MDEIERQTELHKLDVQWQQENLRGAIALAGQTIKSLELVNGGAAIGILTFYGNAVTRTPTSFSFDIAALTNSLLCFGGGVSFAIVCSILAYLSQLATATKANTFVEVSIRRGAILCGLLSAAAFFAGVYFGGKSFG